MNILILFIISSNVNKEFRMPTFSQTYITNTQEHYGIYSILMFYYC